VGKIRDDRCLSFPKLVHLGQRLNARSLIGLAQPTVKNNLIAFSIAKAVTPRRSVGPKVDKPARLNSRPERFKPGFGVFLGLELVTRNLARILVQESDHPGPLIDGVLVFLLGVADAVRGNGPYLPATIFLMNSKCSASAAGNSSMPAGMQSIFISVWNTAWRSSGRSMKVELMNSW